MLHVLCRNPDMGKHLPLACTTHRLCPGARRSWTLAKSIVRMHTWSYCVVHGRAAICAWGRSFCTSLCCEKAEDLILEAGFAVTKGRSNKYRAKVGEQARPRTLCRATSMFFKWLWIYKSELVKIILLVIWVFIASPARSVKDLKQHSLSNAEISNIK